MQQADKPWVYGSNKEQPENGDGNLILVYLLTTVNLRSLKETTSMSVFMNIVYFLILCCLYCDLHRSREGHNLYSA